MHITRGSYHKYFTTGESLVNIVHVKISFVHLLHIYLLVKKAKKVLEYFSLSLTWKEIRAIKNITQVYKTS